MPPPPAVLPPNWQQVDDPSGTYYWNTVTGEVSWTPPTGGTSGPPPALPPTQKRPPGAVGADARNQALSDPAYMNIVNKNATNMRALQKGLSNLDVAVKMPPGTTVPPAPYATPGGFGALPPPSGYSAPPGGGGPPPPGGGGPPKAGPPPGGGGGPPPPGGGGAPKGGPPPGGEKKKGDTPLAQHRLRAIPFYARNVGLLTSAVMMWLGFIMLTTAEYRDGVVTDFQPEKYNQPSPYGGIMIAVCLLGGGGMFAFEFSTFSRETAYVMPWLWTARTALYTGLALPGFFTAVNSQLMPPLLGSIFCVFAAGLNAVSMMAELPSAKAWKAWYHPFWAGGGGKKKEDKEEDLGPTPMGLLESIPKKFVELFEQGKLVRTIFLTWYSLLNLVLYVEAYFRHKGSPVGLALRGEPFFVCTGADGLIRPCKEGPTAIGPVGPLPILQEVGAGNAYPYAKGFGQLLNLNCALMLLPVFRKGVRYLHDISALKGSTFNFIQYILPLDKNIVGHKMIAKYWIFVSVWGHATAHYFNYAKAPYYESEFAKLIGSVPGQTADATHIYVGNSLYMSWNRDAPGRSSFVSVPAQVPVLP